MLCIHIKVLLQHPDIQSKIFNLYVQRSCPKSTFKIYLVSMKVWCCLSHRYIVHNSASLQRYVIPFNSYFNYITSLLLRYNFMYPEYFDVLIYLDFIKTFKKYQQCGYDHLLDNDHLKGYDLVTSYDELIFYDHLIGCDQLIFYSDMVMITSWLKNVL